METSDDYLQDVSDSLDIDANELENLLKIEDLINIKFQILSVYDSLAEFLPSHKKPSDIHPYNVMKSIFLNLLMRWDDNMDQEVVADTILVEDGHVRLLSIDVPFDDSEFFPLSIFRNFPLLQFLNFTNLDLELLNYFPYLIGLGIWRHGKPTQQFPTAMKRLKYLNLHNQELTTHDLAVILPYVENLEMLNISQNDIKSIPINLSDIPNITALDFSLNKIREVNLEGMRLAQIERLLLGANDLRKVDIDLVQFPKLTFIDITNNSRLIEENFENLAHRNLEIKR